MALLKVGESNFFNASKSAGSSAASFCDLALHAMGDREVVGPDVDPVDTRHRQDLVESRHPLHGLDHDHADDRSVGALRTEAAYLERGPGRSPGPVALRWITARADRLARLLFGVDHRHDDPVSPGVERLH